MIVRPEWIEVFNTPKENRQSGVIEGMEYQGATTRLTLTVTDHSVSEEPIHVDMATAWLKKSGFAINQPVWFEVTHQDLCTPQTK